MIKEGIIIGGRYEIMERIGMGGMADVYKAVDRVLRRYVAVKVLKREFREDATFVNKFRSEAQAAAALTHPNIVNIYDVAEDRGLYYIVMELVEGITLKDYIQKKGQLTPKEVIGITLQVCSGIDSAHSNRIIHRDIKPQNIMISKEGKVKVTDFGIAKATSSNTISTNAMGSVHYTSPEQARGGFSDAKSDIYSLGITMYEMLTGRLPFDGDSTVSIALKHLQEDMIMPSEFVPDVPYSLEQIILKCTQKSPDRRYADIASLVRDLKRSIQDPDGDFVRILPLSMASDTILMTSDEMEQLQGASRYESAYDALYDDDYSKKRAKENNSNADLDPKMTNVMKTLIIAAIVVFVIALGVGGYLLVKWFNNPGNVTQSAENDLVPDMVGKTVEEAESMCEKVGLELVVKDATKLHKEYDQGYIYRQATSPNVSRPEGTKIEVYVSAGLEPIEMPDVSDKTEEEAIDALIALGFKDKMIEVQKEENASVKAGFVLRTNPKAGTEDCTTKTTIVIYVSKGVGETIVPKIEGENEEDAKKMLEEAGLRGEPTEISDASEKGKVLEQDQSEHKIGDRVPKGTVIKYKVSKGNKEKIPANLANGKNKIEKVEKKLKDLGFIVDKVEVETTDKSQEDIVISVQNAGYEAQIGSTVTVKYYVLAEEQPPEPPQEPDTNTEAPAEE